MKGCCCVGWNSSVDGSFSYKGRVADEESLSSKRATDCDASFSPCKRIWVDLEPDDSSEEDTDILCVDDQDNIVLDKTNGW